MNGRRIRAATCADPNCHIDRERKMVFLPDGGCCDPCIAHLVMALNAAGVETIASCCGHGFMHGSIVLADRREIMIARDFDEARKIDLIATRDINGARTR